MAGIDDLARRAVNAVTVLARRGAMLALGVALVTGVVAVSSFATGLAALSGDVETAWMVLGGALVIVAVGAPLLAWWRLTRVRQHAVELVDEARTLLSKGAAAERVVIETVEVTDDGRARTAPAVVGQTVQFTRLRDIALSANLRRLPVALYAVTSFPALLAIAVVLMLVFGILGFLFLVAWAL
jgi:hypothetical protein